MKDKNQENENKRIHDAYVGAVENYLVQYASQLAVKQPLPAIPQMPQQNIYNDDGFSLGKIPSDFDPQNTKKVPYFLVKYGDSNQSLFKNVKLCCTFHIIIKIDLF